MHIDDLIRHRQPYAGTAAGGFSFVKTVLHPRQLLRRDADAGIRHRDNGAAAYGGQRHRHGVPAVGVLDGVIQDIDKHLPQPVAVCINDDDALRLLVQQGLVFPSGPLSVHQHHIAQLRRQVHILAGKHHPPALDAGKVQKLLHHLRKPLRLPHDDLHALPPCFGVQVVVAQQRFAPAPYGGQRGAQLVGNRRDEVIFHLLGVTQLLRHIVDGGAQLADLIVIVGVQPHIKVALGDLPGGPAHLAHRRDDGIHEVAAGIQHKQQNSQRHQRRKNGDQGQLPVDGLHRDHIPQPQKVLARKGGKHGHSHDLLALPPPGKGAAFAVFPCHGQVRHGGILRHKPTGGKEHLPLGIQRHQLYPVPVLKILYQLIQPGIKVAARIGRGAFQAGAYRSRPRADVLGGTVIVEGMHGGGNGYDHGHHNDHDNAKAIQ